MPGHNHYPNCSCGWCQGGGGGGGGARLSYGSLPAAGTRTTWDGDGCCYPTSCPICGASVFFVRHNGGSVWFDSLGKPWPKHSCFFDDGYGVRLRTRLGQPSEGTRFSFFGVVLETVVTNPGKSGRIVVQCSDGRKIDEQFNTTSDLTKYPGSLVVVEEGEPGRYLLHGVKGRNSVIEVWDCPKMGYVLVYDPSLQWGIKETESRFWIWDEDRWTTLYDYNTQLLLVPLHSQEATRIACEYLNESPIPPETAVSGPLRALLAARASTRWKQDTSIPATIFAGTPYARCFMLPGTFTAERAAQWVKEVEEIRRPRKADGSRA